MTTLSPRAVVWRERLPLRPGEPNCSHPAPAYYGETAPGVVTRSCRRCGLALASPEPRCSAWVRDSSRRCFAPGRYGGRCRAHRIEGPS